jgi:hypothetical protein
MGNIKAVLAECDDGTLIELNDGDTEDIIHLQSNRLRMELSVAEYRELSAAVICAAMKLRQRKEMPEGGSERNHA